MKYAYVVEGQIQQITTQLPFEWDNIINFRKIENPESYGWYPVTRDENVPTRNHLQKLVLMRRVEGQTVVEYYVVQDLTADEIAALNPVPEQVTSAQAVVILAEIGLLDTVETIIKLYPRTVQIWFERANVWERNNPYVVGLGMELGLDDEQLDDLFRRAAKKL